MNLAIMTNTMTKSTNTMGSKGDEGKREMRENNNNGGEGEEHGNSVYGLRFRVPYVLSYKVNTTLSIDCYYLTITPFTKYNLVDTHAPKMYTHDIEIATHWLSSDYLVATGVVMITIHGNHHCQNT